MINQMVLQGRFTTAPELKQTPTGIPVTTFTIAWSKKYGNGEKTLFLNCNAWNKKAENITKYFSKGQECIVSGELGQRTYETKNREKRTVTELTVSEIHFCGTKQEKSNVTQNSTSYDTREPQFEDVGDDDDLPF